MTKNSQNIQKNSLFTQKELELKDLEEQQVKVATNLKKQKKSLQQLKEDIEHFQRTVGSNYLSQMAELEKTREEVQNLGFEISKLKGLSKFEKKNLKEMAESFSASLFTEEQDDSFKQKQRNEFYQQNQQTFNEFINHFHQVPDDDEKRDIRKVFIGLANRFHPDKAATPQEAEVFHSIMQRINKAYEMGDIDDLWDIEQKYADYQMLQPEEADSLSAIEILERQIVLRRQEIQLLQSQLNRIKTEMKYLKNSEIGIAHSDMFGSKTKRKEFEEHVGYLTTLLNELKRVKEIFERSLKNKKFGEKELDELNNSPFISQQSFIDDDDDFDDLDFEDLLMEMLKSELMERSQKASKKTMRRKRKSIFDFGF